MQLILASSSETRKKILESLGLKFKVIPSQIDESKITASNPNLLVQKIARAKAEAVKKILNSQFSIFNSLILAADSMVVLDSKTIGKPRDKKEAEKILKMLSGKTHRFLTGLYIINTKDNKTWQKFAETKVTFRKLSDKEINDYVENTDVTRFAGGYAVFPGKNKIISQIQGSLTNIMGLPLEILLPILKENEILKKPELSF